MTVKHSFLLIAFIAAVALSCSTMNSGAAYKKTQRDKYTDKIRSGGGINNPVVKAWLAAGEYALTYPLGIMNNYTENGRYTTTNSGASAFIFDLKRGMKVTVLLREKEKSPHFKVYMDMWRAGDNSSHPLFIFSSDTVTNTMEYTAYNDEKLIFRFQKEIGNTGDYFLSLQTGPSLLFPVRSDVKSNIGSLWGEPRDGGARKHEGIDIFAPKGSPLIAVADGTISEVSENAIGGKIIYLRPRGSSIRVYYAHLDEQLVQEDSQVRAGEVIGRVGNTGNAAFTVSHLHFGIYTNAGVAVDPLLFVKPVKITLRNIPNFPPKNAAVTVKNAMVYNDILLNTYYTITEKNIAVVAEALTENHYRVILPDGRKGFISKADLKLQP